MSNRTPWSRLALALALGAGLGCGGNAAKPAEPSTPKTRGAAINTASCNRLFAACDQQGSCDASTPNVDRCMRVPGNRWYECAHSSEEYDPTSCFE